MAERAGIFDQADDFDVSAFAPKKPAAKSAAEPPPEAVRAVSETANFKSREPAPVKAASVKKPQRRRRTGRNLQLNLKVAAPTLQTFYEITDHQGWVLGETLERALAALKRELGLEKTGSAK